MQLMNKKFVIMSKNYKTNVKEFEPEFLEDYFYEFIKHCVYFRTRTLAIKFLTDNTSLTYNEASKTENLRGIIMRFSRITTHAKQENIVKKCNKRTYKIIKKVK